MVSIHGQRVLNTFLKTAYYIIDKWCASSRNPDLLIDLNVDGPSEHHYT